MSTLEYAQVEQTILEGLKVGTQVLQEIQKEMNMDDVQQLMADTHEAIQYQKVFNPNPLILRRTPYSVCND